MFRPRLLALAFVSASLLAPSMAQEFSDTTSVVVVEVPVNVTRNGAPVSDLTAEDFEITDEGKKQVISGFEVIDLRQEESATQLGSMSTAARRHFVFVFDLSFSEPNAISRARQSALELVRTSLHPTDLISVATYSNRRGPELVLNFTTDRRQVEGALSTLGVLGKKGVADPLGIVVRDNAIGEDRRADGSGGGGGRTGLAANEEIEAALERTEGLRNKANVKERLDIFTNTFGFLAEMLAPLDGRKHVVFLSEGFDASSLFGTADQERIAELQAAAEFGQIWDVDSDERLGSTQALDQINAMLRSFKQADAIIHSIDIAGLRTDGASASARGRQDGLFMLSSETNGEFYRNYNDLSGAMVDMLDATSVTYLLAFQPTDPRRKSDSYHRLKVKLKSGQRGTKLSYREGYYPPGVFGSLNEVQSNLRASQQIHSGAPAGGITAQVLATPLRRPVGRAYVPVLLQIPASEFGEVPMGEQFPIELYVYAMDAEGEVRDHLAESLTFDVEQVGSALQSTGLKFYGHLDLDPGDYALRVMVRDGRTGSTSMEVTPLTVPEFGESYLAVLPPLFPEETGHWVMVRESSERAQVEPVAYPFMFKGQSFVPAVNPVFEPGQVVAVSLMAAKSSTDWLEVGSLVLGPDGAPIPGVYLRVLERERDTESGLVRMIGAFEVPHLPGGDYQLVVTMSDNSTGDVESGTIPFSLGQRGENLALFEPPRWMPDLADVLASLGPDDQRSIVKIDKNDFRSGYEDVLRQLADGRQNGAVLSLAELEGASLNVDNPVNSMAQMSKLEQKVLDQVTRRDPDNLLPVILLHKEAYSQYRLRKETFLAVHAKSMTLQLIDVYSRRAKTTESKQMASRILTGMAAEVYGFGAHISAQEMFERAIELDKTNASALLGLGFILENMGQGDDKIPKYDEAVRILERAVAIDPDLYEARLRLAINLGRLEQGLQGAKQLQLLIQDEDVPPWIASVAYQELARLYLETEGYAEARRVLERGVERLPEDSKLALQLAYVYERTQQQRKAKQATRRALGESLSARFLYLQVPQLLEESGSSWTAAAVARLPALASALEPEPTGIGS